MTALVHPITLGNLVLPNNVFYSPLAGCSDFPFRQMAARYKPGLHYCEMVKMDALVRHDRGTHHLLDYNKEMHPLGAQLCGGNLSVVAQAAQIIEDMGFDVIDLNCGCPVDKVTKDGGGSCLLKTPELIGELLTKMVAAVRIPVTVKIRAGWDEQSINACEVTQIAEQAGAKAIAIHGRTRKQAYRGKANWDYIRDCKMVAKDILVIGNGDVFDGEAGAKMLEYTGCDVVLASRGTLGQPWLAEDICRFVEGKPIQERGQKECLEELKEHFQCIKAYKNERQAVLDMRRVGCWYLKKGGRARDFRRLMSRVSSLKQVDELIEEELQKIENGE